MHDYIRTHIHITVHLLVIAVALIASAAYLNYAQSKVEREMVGQTNRITTTLMGLAEVIDRNGADETVSAIITDCGERNEYESLLVKLGTLPKKDLLRIQTLSDSCGAFYSERKALMVSRFEREYQVLLDLNQIMHEFGIPKISNETMAAWSELIELEKKRSGLLTDQVNIQDKIIRALVMGSGVNSKEVSELVHEAKQVAELLVVYDHDIDTLRKKLSS